jgi:predicted nucleotide-binding protein (sugar kinase/HSP70/actin superfamily)
MEFFAHKEKIIGIPRALTYYNYYPFWYGFFTKLGIKIVLSSPTTKKTVAQGSSLVVSETCLPIKVYVGHVVDLVERGVENIFVPSVQSIAPKIYNCSKIRGLPDLIRNVVKGKFKIIEATLDKSEKNLGLYDFLSAAVAPFKIRDKKLIKEASKAGWVVYNNFMIMMQHGLSFDNALKNATQGNVIIPPQGQEKFVSVAVVAHAYNIYDTKICMDIFKKLENLGVRAYKAYELTEEQLKKGVVNLSDEIYWANELEMTGCAGHYLANQKIDGIITITAFGCGPDSLMIERMVRKSKSFNKSVLNLTIDEHTGEAGFITRIEAFCDMLYRKKRNAVKKLDEIIKT